MALCEKIMSWFTSRRYMKVQDTGIYTEYPEDSEVHYLMENPFLTHCPMYAIRERRQLMDGSGSYTVYVINYEAEEK